MTGPILLTGAGGDIGISIARCLHDAFPEAMIVGADCKSDNPGKAFFDTFSILPRADDPSWLPSLKTLIKEHGARFVLPLAEAELSVLMRQGLLQTNIETARIISPNHKAVQTGLDKLLTNNVLLEAGIEVPESGLVGDADPGDYDVVIKPRSGQGSKGIAIVSRGSFDAIKSARSGDLWQRYLSDADAEYTCGIARFPAMDTRVISFRRKLAGGLTGSGSVNSLPELERLGERVADVLKLRGAVNMQLRMSMGKLLIFEINPRFSSTVGFRHKLGYRDVIWSLKDALGEGIESYEPPVAGTRIYRVAEEVILPPI